MSKKHTRRGCTQCCFPKGFTLIELLVVVLIIGILAAVALPQYQQTVLKARYMQLMVLGNAVYKGEVLYHLANGQYTSTLSDLDIALPETTETSFCYLDVNEVKCELMLTGSSKLRYNLDLRYPGWRQCRVYGSNELAEKVCANLTGDTQHLHNGPIYSEYTFK